MILQLLAKYKQKRAKAIQKYDRKRRFWSGGQKKLTHIFFANFLIIKGVFGPGSKQIWPTIFYANFLIILQKLCHKNRRKRAKQNRKIWTKMRFLAQKSKKIEILTWIFFKARKNWKGTKILRRHVKIGKARKFWEGT